MNYKEIELTPPAGSVQFTHSIILDIIRGKPSSQYIDWSDRLGKLPWSRVKAVHPQTFDDTSRLFSVMHLNYQVCNGGIEQYFGNKYHEDRDPHQENDIALYDIDAQKEEMKALVKFAREIYPQRSLENEYLSLAAQAFQNVSLEEDARVSETIECEEDEYILDEETGEEIENPDWFEPYEDYHYEDVIHGGDEFEQIFFKDFKVNDVNRYASSYLEEIMELRSQYIFKNLEKELEKMEQTPDICALLSEMREGEASSLEERIADAQSRKGAAQPAQEKDLSEKTRF